MASFIRLIAFRWIQFLPVVLFFGLLLSRTLYAASPEYVMDNETVSGSVKDVESPLGLGFLKEYEPTYIFKWIRGRNQGKA